MQSGKISEGAILEESCWPIGLPAATSLILVSVRKGDEGGGGKGVRGVGGSEGEWEAMQSGKVAGDGAFLEESCWPTAPPAATSLIMVSIET